MPKKLNPEEPVTFLMRVTKQQAKDLDFLISKGRLGSSRPEVVKYFLVRELDRLEQDGRLGSSEKS